ncbi:MAG: hypothetical protein M1838_004420 [Thelocarpon superellum]|nr:MAG: hypothetical protein M1838_004420 [Thelocarpon superellum]
MPWHEHLAHLDNPEDNTDTPAIIPPAVTSSSEEARIYQNPAQFDGTLDRGRFSRHGPLGFQTPPRDASSSGIDAPDESHAYTPIYIRQRTVFSAFGGGAAVALTKDYATLMSAAVPDFHQEARRAAVEAEHHLVCLGHARRLLQDGVASISVDGHHEWEESVWSWLVEHWFRTKERVVKYLDKTESTARALIRAVGVVKVFEKARDLQLAGVYDHASFSKMMGVHSDNIIDASAGFEASLSRAWRRYREITFLGSEALMRNSLGAATLTYTPDLIGRMHGPSSLACDCTACYALRLRSFSMPVNLSRERRDLFALVLVQGEPRRVHGPPEGTAATNAGPGVGRASSVPGVRGPPSSPVQPHDATARIGTFPSGFVRRATRALLLADSPLEQGRGRGNAPFGRTVRLRPSVPQPIGEVAMAA